MVEHEPVLGVRYEDNRASWYALRVVFFFLPFIVATLGIYIIYFSLPWETFAFVGGLIILYFFPPAGKESVIPLMVVGLKLNYGYGMLGCILIPTLAIAFVDAMDAFFLVWNFDLLKYFPFMGKWLEKFERKGRERMKKGALARGLAFVGVVLFVMFPFQGSGGVGGSILGRIIGMKKLRVFAAVIVGALVGCALIATIVWYVGPALVEGLKSASNIGILVVIAIVTIYIVWWWRRKNGKKNGGEEAI